MLKTDLLYTFFAMVSQMELWSNHNIVKLLQNREKNGDYAKNVKRYSQFTESLIKRLGLEYELEGHQGCVNCLQWTADGRCVLPKPFTHHRNMPNCSDF